MPLVPWPVHRISMGSASFMQEIELFFLSRYGDGEHLRGWRPDRHDDCVHGLRDGVSPSWLHWPSASPAARSCHSSGEKERQPGGSSHCPSGFVSLSLSHTHEHWAMLNVDYQTVQVAKLPSRIACEQDRNAARQPA